ncbi:MAG: hypothetical protein Tsb0019_17380 [Roseibium sp.]
MNRDLFAKKAGPGSKAGAALSFEANSGTGRSASDDTQLDVDVAAGRVGIGTDLVCLGDQVLRDRLL